MDDGHPMTPYVIESLDNHFSNSVTIFTPPTSYLCLTKDLLDITL